MADRQIQYTLRGVPEHIDHALRERAARHGKSLNQVAVEALEGGLGLTQKETRFHDLDHLAGTWVDDPEFDAAIEEMDRIDPEMWR